ncbi:hypothetical protein ACWEOV_39415 [Streptomyces sp. NPDC004365]
MLRSSNHKAAVDEGVLADDGAVGAVVINSAREAVQARYFDDGTHAPKRSPCPRTCRPSLAAGEDRHGNWLHRWDHHITRLP